MLRTLSAFGLAILLSIPPALAAEGAPGEQVRQTVDRLLAILKDPQLKGRKQEE